MSHPSTDPLVAPSAVTAAAHLAAAQAGALSRQQLRELVLSDDVVRANLHAGRWRGTLPGVYVTFTGPVPYLTRCWAALLYAGPGAALSHDTAAWLQGWRAMPGVVHVSVPHGRQVRGQPGLRLHRSRTLADGIHPVALPERTRVERTVVDVVDASKSSRDALAGIADALRTRVTEEERVREAVTTATRIRWRRPVLRALAVVSAGAESPLELDHARIEAAHRLPACERQVRMTFGQRVCRVDAVDAFGLVRELDGRLGHEDAKSSWRDMHRDNGHVTRGRAVLRFGHIDLMTDPCGVAAQEVEALRHRGWAGNPRRCRPGCTAGLG